MELRYKGETIGGGSGEIYSTEETRIGTWIDGKPLYMKVYTGFISNSEWTTISSAIPPIDFAIIYCSGFIDQSYYSIPVATSSGKSFFALNLKKHELEVYNNIPVFVGKKIWAIVKYTKTTD